MLARLASSNGSGEADASLAEAAYALLDDLGLVSEPGRNVGGLFHTPAEADAVRRVAATLDEVLGSVGTCSLEERNMQHRGWAEVIAAVRAAYDILT
jgi:hypothetical protein